MKKLMLLLSSLLLIVLSLGNVNAFDKEAKIEAEKFIQEESSDIDSTWYKNNPTIVKEIPFYSDNDKKASYIEYKIACENTKDCGFVIVNLDRTDTKVPFASFWGKSLSEQMGSSKGNKNYYFGAFEQFSISKTGEIKSTSPENKSLNNNQNIYLRSSHTNSLYKKFLKLQKQEKNNKSKYIEFQKKKKKDIKNASAYRRSSKVVVPGSNFTGGSCNSPTPCYQQWKRAYSVGGEIKWGYTGCTPTAFSILYGYYNKNGYNRVFPNISSSSTPSTMTRDIRNIQIVIGNLMGTYWSQDSDGGNEHQGSTDISDNPKGWEFLDGKYSYNSDYEGDYFWNDFLSTVKNEINHNRPIIIGLEYLREGNTNKSGHTVVGHGYKGNKIYVNFGWGVDDANSVLNTNGKDFTSPAITNASNERMDRLDYMKIN